jgi:hypothetical protein
MIAWLAAPDRDSLRFSDPSRGGYACWRLGPSFYSDFEANIAYSRHRISATCYQNDTNTQHSHTTNARLNLAVKKLIRRSKLSCSHALLLEQPNRLLVKAEEGFTAKPRAFVGDHAVRKIATCFQHGQTSFNGGAVHFDLARV